MRDGWVRYMFNDGFAQYREGDEDIWSQYIVRDEDNITCQLWHDGLRLVVEHPVEVTEDA